MYRDQFLCKPTWKLQKLQKEDNKKQLWTLWGFEALHGEIPMYIWFAVTPCVYLLAG